MKKPAAAAASALLLLTGCAAPADPTVAALPSLAPADFPTGRITPSVSPTPEPSPSTAPMPVSPLPDEFDGWKAYNKTQEPNTVLVYYRQGTDRDRIITAGFIKSNRSPEVLRDTMKNPADIGEALCGDGDKPDQFTCATQAPGGVVIGLGRGLTRAEVAELTVILAGKLA